MGRTKKQDRRKGIFFRINMSNFQSKIEKINTMENLHNSSQQQETQKG